MACHQVQLPEGFESAIICVRGLPKCWHKCGGRSEYQCDFPVGRYKSGKRTGEIRTCDRHICSDHVRHGVTPGIDFCEEHYPLAKAAYERRQNSPTAAASTQP